MRYEYAYKRLRDYINEEFDPNKHEFPETMFNELKKAIELDVDEAGYNELERIFHHPKWRNKVIGQINKYEVVEYIAERIDKLRENRPTN